MLQKADGQKLGGGRFGWVGRGLFVLAVLLVAWSAGGQSAAESEDDSAPALLIIDVQEFYFPGGAVPLTNPQAASLNIKRLLEKWRDAEHLVIHIGHNAGQGAAFHPDVKPMPGEKVIFKDEVSAFKGTELSPYLQEQGVGELLICGMQTHMCVEAAVRAAADLGFTCILVHDACATRNLNFADCEISAQDVHASTLSTLNRVYAEVVDTETVLATYR
jgi:nicotinamidase-related amidase